MFKRKILLPFFFIPLTFIYTFGQEEDYKTRRSYTIIPTVDKISIDGLLDEDTWNIAESSSDFYMSFPVDNRLADQSIQTEVKLAYDNNFLYIAAVCYGNDNYVIQFYFQVPKR